MTYLLIIGLLFPLISFITFLLSLYEGHINKRHSSSVFIPFIGPIVLDIAILIDGKPLWWLLLPWLLDIGTLAFLYVMPRLIKEAWETSKFNQVACYQATSGIKTAVLSLFKNGHYGLRLKWDRKKGEMGISGAGDLGTYVFEDNELFLTSHTKEKRRLAVDGENLSAIEEDEGFPEHLSIKGLLFEIHAKK